MSTIQLIHDRTIQPGICEEETSVHAYVSNVPKDKVDEINKVMIEFADKIENIIHPDDGR